MKSGWHGMAGLLPSPGEHDAARRVDLDKSAKDDVSAVGIDPEYATGPCFELHGNTHPLEIPCALDKIGKYVLRTGLDEDFPGDWLIVGHVGLSRIRQCA